MKALPTLLRIARRDLDALRHVLAEALGKRAAVDARLAAHDEALAQEQRIALQSYEHGRAYGGYAALALAQRRALAAEGAAIDEEIERIRAFVTEAHIEVKKAERLLELHQAREEAATRRRQDAEMDEIATLRAGRRR
ncbi:MAG: hypothetical protein AB7O04_04490 [Hyphomonadaceae bacterium]